MLNFKQAYPIVNVTVIEEDRSCTVSVSSNPLHIMRSSSTKLSCGTKSQPWMLEAPAGQQISVSLVDFGVNTRETQLQNNCLQYGYIVDKSANKNVSICGLSDERRKDIYTSVSNVVRVVLSNEQVESDAAGDRQSTVIVGFKGLL